MKTVRADKQISHKHKLPAQTGRGSLTRPVRFLSVLLDGSSPAASNEEQTDPAEDP